MLLALQTLFSPCHIALFHESGEVLERREWPPGEHPNLVALVQEILLAQKFTPLDITGIMAVAGPGPFTAVRTVAVLLQIWKQERPEVELLAVPSGVFLSEMFPQAEVLFLSAGTTAFFMFDPENPAVFEKLPNAELKKFQEKRWGGKLLAHHLESLQHKEGFSPEEETVVWDKLWKRRREFVSLEFLPVYGAEPAIASAAHF